LDNKDKGPESRPTLLADFLRILDEQTEEKEAQKTFPKMKGYSQGGFIHITSLEPSEEEEIKSSIELNLKKQSEDKASEEKEWNSKLIAIQEKAKPKLNKLKAKTLAAAYTSKFSMKRAIDRGDFTAVLALLKNTAEYEVVAGKLKPYVEEREKIGPTPKVLDTKEQERISLLLIGGKTMDTLGEKANRVFFEKLNSIVSDERAKVNKDLPIIIQLMVGMHVICLISDEKTKTTLVDDINCTKLITLSSGQADIFINEAARAISFTEIKDEAKSEAKNIIETHAILYNVKLEVIPTSEKEHVEGWFKGNPKNKLYDRTFYKVTK
jgi:hypothetical protein